MKRRIRGGVDPNMFNGCVLEMVFVILVIMFVGYFIISGVVSCAHHFRWTN